MNDILLICGSNRDAFSYNVLLEIEKNINNSKILKLKDYDIKYCIGCLSCDKEGKCIIDDNLKLIIKEIEKSNTIVFAIPNYFGGMSGFFKNFIDRLHFTYKRSIFKNKKIIFIYTGALIDDSVTMEQLTDSTKHIETYLEFNVVGRFSFSSRKELDKDKVNSIINLIKEL